MARDTERYSASTIDNWNFRDRRVAFDRGGKNGGSFLSSESTMIAFGPARLSDLANVSLARALTPIGVADGFQKSQSKQNARIYEIGSRRSLVLGGRVMCNFSLSRLLMHAPNFLRFIGGATGLTISDVAPATGKVEVSSGAGFDDFAPIDQALAQHGIDLNADIFDFPFGILVYQLDQKKRPVNAVYGEDCSIDSQSDSVQSSNSPIMESISGSADRWRPVNVSRVLQ